ncbi:MAG: glutathione peroxidase [Deltaproteobacteria bacterium]|nr:MAG: glutathione peroxidase [Deltaproteobacteria bacterium]
MTRLDGAPLEGEELEGSVVLVVNVASKCGFTPQYEGLQRLHDKYQARGLRVVGVPCNQFAGQEPGDAEKIQDFCKKNYGVEFTMLEKQDVNGKDRSDLYRFLIDSEVGAGRRVKWNFEKFLVNRKGEVVHRWGSRTKPDDPELIEAVEALL